MLYQSFLYILLLGLYFLSAVARPDEKYFRRVQRNYDEADYKDDDSEADERSVDMMNYHRRGGRGDGRGEGGEGGRSHSLTNSGSNNKMYSQHKALNIAIKAAQEARSASDSQMSAAAGAAQEVKSQMAEKAMTAAKAAEAALLGKQQIVAQLVQEVREAEAIVHEEGTSLQNSHYNAEAACQASQQAHLQFKTLSAAVQIAQDNVDNAEIAANGAAQELGEKKALAEAAKNRVEILLRQLNTARNDFANTRKAAFRAACAAQAAKQKAES